VITAEIQAMFLEHRGFYGSPRIHQELRAAGLHAKTCQAFRPCSKTSAEPLLGWRHHLHPHHSRLALCGGVAPRGVLSKLDGSVQPPRRWLEIWAPP